MALTTTVQLATSLSGPDQDNAFYFATATTALATYANLGRLAINSFGTAAVPTVRTSGGQIVTDQTGYPLIAAPPAGQSLYLGKATIQSVLPGTLLVYDRIWSASGFDGSLTTEQTVTGAPTLPTARAPGNGEQLEIWAEAFTAAGTTTSNISVRYTNSAGVGSRSTLAVQQVFAGTAARMQRLPLQDGDSGVRSVEGLTFAATTGGAGNLGISLMRLKAILPLQAMVPGSFDFASLGLAPIDPDAALTFVHLAQGSTSGVIMGTLNIVAG